jgi:iron complex transport system substrate-binding protein
MAIKEKTAGTGKVIALALTLALCMSLMVGCGTPSQSQESQGSGVEQDTAAEATTVVTDMAGRTVEVPTEVQSIIGIGSSSLRMISYLQATDMVAGVEVSEHEPSVTWAYNWVYQDVFKDLPVIGEGGSKGVTPNEEAIIQAAPQVIFASIDVDMADLLFERTGIPVVVITLSDIVFDQVFYDNIALMGDILGKESRADELIKYMKDTEQDLKDRTASISSDTIVTAYAAGISFRGGHGFAGTEANFPPFDAVEVENIADEAGVTGAFDIDLEKVSSAQPDIIFIESGNIGLVLEDYQNNPDFFASLDAVQNDKVYSLIGYRFYATNIELALANCYQVGAQAYPEQFSDINPAKKLDEITEFFLGAKMYSDLAAAGYTFDQVDLSKL